MLNLEIVARADSKAGYSQEASNWGEHFKEKRRRTNSIMQIENKIVKGWNQMINDLTPKFNNVSSSIAYSLDGNRDSVDDAKENIDLDNAEIQQKNLTHSGTIQFPLQIESRCSTIEIINLLRF